MHLVLVGPMSIKPNLNFPEFDWARDQLTALGHHIQSPADLSRQMRWVFEQDAQLFYSETFDYETAMAHNFTRIEQAEGIVLLPGFAHSPGAIRELHHALTCGKQIWYVHDWDDPKPIRRIS